jgi:hypothetical protein
MSNRAGAIGMCVAGGGKQPACTSTSGERGYGGQRVRVHVTMRLLADVIDLLVCHGMEDQAEVFLTDVGVSF